MSNTNLITIGDLLAGAERRLSPLSETFQLDAQVLLAHILKRERSWLLAHPEAQANREQLQAWEQSLTRLEFGEPLPYVLGEWEFYGLKFFVSPEVLIPRPETELLVDEGRAWLRANPGRRRATDVGTGSGCIAVALAYNIPDLQIEAGDISTAALEVAKANVWRYDLQRRVHLHWSDLLSNLFGFFDLICANLPYIPEERLAKLAVSKFEPRVALTAGPDGFALIRKFMEQAVTHLAPGGLLLAELDASQEKMAPDLARSIWPKAEIEVRNDLAGLPRLLRVET